MTMIKTDIRYKMFEDISLQNITDIIIDKSLNNEEKIFVFLTNDEFVYTRGQVNRNGFVSHLAYYDLHNNSIRELNFHGNASIYMDAYYVNLTDVEGEEIVYESIDIDDVHFISTLKYKLDNMNIKLHGISSKMAKTTLKNINYIEGLRTAW